MRKSRGKKKEREKGEEDEEIGIPGNYPRGWRRDLVQSVWAYCFIEDIKQI